MDSEVALKLPVIDFSNPELKPGTPEWESVRSQVLKALEYYGSFEAVYDGVGEDARETVFSAAKEFFELPLEIKDRGMVKPYVNGYSGSSTAESMGFPYATNYAHINHYTNIFWSQGNPNFTQNIYKYTEQISELDKTVRKMIVESLRIEKYMDEHMNSTYYQFRFNHYTPRETKESMGNTHTDHTMISIIHQNGIDGLEFQTKEGEWIQYKPSSPNSYAVLTGESLYAWTNGRLHCPQHRVSPLTGDKDRYSLVVFSLPNKGYIIKTPPELVDKDHPLLFKPFEYFEFQAFLQSEDGGPIEK